MSDQLRKITILHSNDIHGTFAGKTDENGMLTCNIAQVGGYVANAKAENPDTIYCIAGDVFQGSLIDTDYQGLSSMEILNLIDIDVMSLGNHELDYGISHMLFASRYADFPVINANFIVRSNNKFLFQPFHLVRLDGLSVLFIGLITSEIIDQTRTEAVVGPYVKIGSSEEAIRRVRKMLEESGVKADITVLLTHIGYEHDLELARTLDPSMGVDIIVGGHSHTYINEPAVENGIVVLQAGVENTHLGRFDFWYDEDEHTIDHWNWEMIPVDEDHCPADGFVKAMVNTYVMDIDEKYGSIVTRFRRTLDNTGRGNPTELGQVFADAFADALDLDIMFMAASSTRCYSMDMTVTVQDLREAYPYDGMIYRIQVTGEMLKYMIEHMLRDEVLDDWADAFFHTSRNLHIYYNKDAHNLWLTYKGLPVRDGRVFTVGIQEYYYQTSESGLGMKQKALCVLGKPKVAALDGFEVLKDYLSAHQGLGGEIDDRCVIRGTVRGVKQ